MIKEIIKAFLRRGCEASSPEFLSELNANLERVFVMEQRQIISLKLELRAIVPFGFEDYVSVVQEYNMAFDDHQACASEYKADLTHQTRANAIVLDQKYDVLRERFAALKPMLSATKDKVDTHERA